ncbi:MAG: type II toxin-antitoxin system RelE/ParE family toxin [Oscillospiraceae bacterium]|nr:type II toxin-antitoxin system RelE/ParE family toxin [Oscillospiraceae bacterium]
MNYRLEKKPQQFLDKQNDNTARHIISKILDIPNGDIKKLTGRDNYRLRIGKVRVFYYIENDIVIVTKIENRGDAYKKNYIV